MIEKRLIRTGWQRTILVALLAASGATASFAQWQWIDGTGSRVFSDTPPPAGTPDKNILKRPGPMGAKVPADTPDLAGATPVNQPAQASATDKELESRKQKAEEAEKSKKKAEMERVAKLRAENCERARRAKTTLDSGVRMVTTNAKGEREVMDDSARAREGQRLAEIIGSDCGPMPQAQTGQ